MLDRMDMNSIKLTNIVLTAAISLFVAMAIIGLVNQTNILENQNEAASLHNLTEREANIFIKDNIIGKDNVTKLFNKLDIIINQTK